MDNGTLSAAKALTVVATIAWSVGSYWLWRKDYRLAAALAGFMAVRAGAVTAALLTYTPPVEPLRPGNLSAGDSILKITSGNA